MAGFGVQPLDEATWPDFARLVEKHNGVWGGCWCIAFHPEGADRSRTPERNRAAKERRVREGRAHAALVYDGATCLGWCQFGSPEELPRIKNKRAYPRSSPSFPIGGSPASSSTRHSAGKASPPVPSQERCSRSPASAVEPWRATPSPSGTGPSPPPSCTP